MRKYSVGLTIAIVAILVVGAGGLAVANSFLGNPITASKAKSQIEAYVKTTYPAIQAEVQPVSYNFKNGGSYSSLVQAVDSPDTVFRVIWEEGGRMEDTYAEVTALETTFNRLEKEVDAAIERIVTEQFPYETRLVGGRLQETENRTAANSLRRDMDLDLSRPPMPLHLVVWCSAERPTYRVMAERLLELQEIMERYGIPVAFYSMNVEYPYVEENGSLMPKQWDSVTVADLPAERLQELDLPAALEAYHQEWERKHGK